MNLYNLEMVVRRSKPSRRRVLEEDCIVEWVRVKNYETQSDLREEVSFELCWLVVTQTFHSFVGDNNDNNNDNTQNNNSCCNLIEPFLPIQICFSLLFSRSQFTFLQILTSKFFCSFSLANFLLDLIHTLIFWASFYSSHTKNFDVQFLKNVRSKRQGNTNKKQILHNTKSTASIEFDNEASWIRFSRCTSYRDPQKDSSRSSTQNPSTNWCVISIIKFSFIEWMIQFDETFVSL